MPRPRWLFLAVLLAALVAFLSLAPALALAQEGRQVHGIDPADMDLSVDPAEDFYRFANGGWLDRTEIPADQGSYGVFEALDDTTTEQLLDVLNRLAAGGELREGSDEWKAVQLFRQGTDLATRNAQGIAPIQPALDQIAQVDDLAELHLFLQGSMFLGIEGFLPVVVFAGLEDSTVNELYVNSPTFGLPNRDYYLEEAPGNAEIRAAYVEACAELLTLVGQDPATARAAAQAVYDLERALAEPTLTREEQQDISLANNPRTVAELASIYPLMDWPAYFQALGTEELERVTVLELRYLEALPAILEGAELSAIKDLLRLQLLWSFRYNLNEAVATTAFDFRGKVLSGLEEAPPVEELALDEVNSGMGEALGQIYVAEYFPPEAKAQITELVEAEIDAFERRLQANTWMSPETKTIALDKLSKVGVKVGYPDRWRGYEAVEVTDSYAGTVLSAANAELRRTLQNAGKPVDKSEWFIPPQVVNAFYDPQNNEILFPAAILQPPFFDYRADPASNFGAIGFVIGHELTHGFDITGSQFDAEGNLVNWWTEADRERFDALNQRVVEQYGAIEVLPGLFVDGQITVGENVADLGGLQIAHDGLMQYLDANGSPLPPPPGSEAAARDPGLTQEQRFFVAAATTWREVIRDEFLARLVKEDVHAPGSVRGTMPLRNMDEFHEAFGIEPGDAMYLPPEERIVVW